MEDRNKCSITHPLMPSSLHLSVALPFSDVMPLCISSASIHVPFVSFLTPLSGSQASGVLGFFSFYYLISSYFLSSRSSSLFLVCFLSFARLLLQIPSIFPMCGQGLESFNLPNKLGASLSPAMCVCERNMFFFSFLDFGYASAVSH